MKYKFFNKWDFQQIMSLYNNDPREALRQFEIYLSKYPEDYSAYTYYMSLLIRLGHFEDAENFVIWLENRLYSDQNYLSSLKAS